MARPRVFGQIVEVRRGASAPLLRLCIGFKLANSLPKGPMLAAYTLTCPEPATPPCRGCPPDGLAAWPSRDARVHRLRPHSCNPHPAGRARPKYSFLCVGNNGGRAQSALPHRLLGLAAPARRCPSCRNRGKIAYKGGGRLVKEAEAVERRVEVAACLQRLAPREQLACIDGPPSNIRSAGLHRIVWHANRPAFSPRSIARIRPSPHVCLPGAEVKSKDALRGGSDARDEEGARYPRILPHAAFSKMQISNFSPFHFHADFFGAGGT